MNVLEACGVVAHNIFWFLKFPIMSFLWFSVGVTFEKHTYSNNFVVGVIITAVVWSCIATNF